LYFYVNLQVHLLLLDEDDIVIDKIFLLIFNI